MITNSAIINSIIKMTLFITNAFNLSLTGRVLQHVDNFLKNTIYNSFMFKMLIRKEDGQIAGTSKLYAIIRTFLKSISSLKPIIKKMILGSKITAFWKSTIITFEENPLRIISIVGIAFLVSNVSYGVIATRTSILSLIIKIALLLVFMLFRKADVSAKKLFIESHFYKLYKWIVYFEG